MACAPYSGSLLDPNPTYSVGRLLLVYCYTRGSVPCPLLAYLLYGPSGYTFRNILSIGGRLATSNSLYHTTPNSMYASTAMGKCYY